MAEKEMQAHDMVRRRSWSRAVALYDPILAQLQPTINSSSTNASINVGNINALTAAASAASTRSQKDRQIACLLGRCECLLELGKYENCLADARKVLVLLTEQSDCLASISRARRWLIHALCKLKKYMEAEQTVREWISEIAGQQSFADISKTLERYKSIIQMISGHKTTQKISLTRLEDEMSILDTKLDHWATNNLPLDKYSKLLSNKGLKKRDGNGAVQQMPLLSQQNGTSSSSSTSSGSLNAALFKTTDLLAAIKMAGGKNAGGSNGDLNDNGTTCSYCAINFQTRNELRQHCQTESHQNVIMSDEGRDWKWRPPPRGFTLDSYSLCESYSEPQSCQYGNQCVEAHGIDELNEWKERFEYRRMRLQKACEKELYGKSYTEQVLERWIQATAPERIMTEKIDEVEDKCEQELVTSISSKSSIREWVFVLKTRKQLRAVALLQDAHRNHFAIKSINTGIGLTEVELKSDQEWVTFKSQSHASSSLTTDSEKKQDDVTSENSLLEHQVSIEFHTEIYGTFRQAVCFDFGQEPLLVKHLCVDVVPVSDAEKIEEIKRDIISSSSQRWDVSNSNFVKFETTIGTHLKTEAYLNDLKHEKEMLERYPCPRAQTFTLTQSTIVEKRLTQNNYRSRIHELLYVEEIARYEQIARYNVRTKLTVTSNYILTPAGMATSTAKYSLTGELFALMRLGKDISEDTSAGRLILSNCSSVYISAPEDATAAGKDSKKRNVFEAVIEDKGKNVIYLKLSAKCVEVMGLKADTDVDVDIQFQLNRLPYCEWHNAVDKITDFKIIFPATEIEPNIPWTPKKQWSETCEPKLNAKQREAVNAITTSLSIKLPPILLIGPFGTGKTYTLAQAIKQLLSQPEAKILICTHSNSAADLYIKEYLHPWIEEGMDEATPLRVYYHKRWVATVNSVVQKYCITDGAGNFRRPTVDDIMKHRIVVVTLSISMELATLGLPKGYFTHIFLDEAAQAMECEAIMPLALANDGTRIVLAGDHMQMSPELFSAFAKERKLHISLLERLYGHYPSNFPCKILLCENYRAHEAIIKFTSELFYEQKLIASGKQPRHERFYPLTFFTTRGEDVQDKNSTAFYNNAEVYEVVERVSELRKKWPASWGKINDASIGIMTPYADQVFRIRSELRKRRMGGISVERVLNVQGKQFRAVFLSTVRTRRTCLPNAGGLPGNTSNPTEDADYGFLSNSKLLNTAITRAQSLVAVVGDPVALCSIGRCRKVWERFIEICDENKSLFGLTWGSLRSQLDGVELKRGYVLNPLAPEFIPRALQPEAYLRDQAAMYLLGNSGPVNNVGGHHGPGHHNSGPGVPQHGGMMGGSGGVPVPQHHPSMGGGNQQMPHMYAQHPAAAAAAYNAAMMNQGMPGKSGGGGGHHFPGHPNHMPMRPLGPPQSGSGPQQQQPPPLGGQQFNPRGPPPPGHLGQQAPGIPPPPSTAAQFSQYMAWQQAQQQIRGGPPPSGGGFPPGGQQGGPPSQNPNASLWGPPPQNNPWGALPKQQPPPPQSAGGRPIPPQQAVPGMRGPVGNMQPPSQPSNQQQMRGNPSDLGYLAKKTLYGQQHPPQPQPNVPPHANFPPTYGSGGGSNMGNPPPPPPNQLQMLNQRNIGSMPNGPISPMDPFMLRQSGNNQQVPPLPPQSNFFGSANNLGIKDKDFQFLNNVHVPLNVGGTMFQTPAPPGAVPPNKQQSPSTFRFHPQQDYSALLPPNMNIYEMAFEPKESQYKWYLKLLEIHGQEAANKFTEVLRQVMTMIHQQQSQQQPGKPPQMHPPHLNASQMLPREIMQQQQQGLPPILTGAGGVGVAGNQINTQIPQQQQQQQRNSVPPFLTPGINAAVAAAAAGSSQLPSILATNDDTQPLDGNINFNQQIDLVFNSLMNGNEISQPILRDLLGMVGGSSSNSGNNVVSNSNVMNSVNGDLIISAQTQQQSKVFPIMGANVNSQQQQQQQHQVQQNMKPHIFPMHMQQQQQSQPNSAFMGNNSLLNNKDLILSSTASSIGGGVSSLSSSVPLYRRQAMTMGNGNINSNYNSSNSSSSTGAHSIASSTPDNILNSIGGANEILSGLGTAGNLIDAIFQANPTPEQQQSNTAFQKLLYNNYATAAANLKPNELDLFMRMERDPQQLGGVGMGIGLLDTNGVVNNHHHQQQHHQQHHHAQQHHQQQQQQQHHQQQQQQQHHQQQQQQQIQHFQNVTSNTGGSGGGVGAGGGNVVGTSGSGIIENRNTTYAAVLSQGPQHIHHQHEQQQQPQQHTHHNFHTNIDGQMEIEKDPFAAIRELGQGTNGFYNYFQ